jgi:large subunit ribosomal protein L35
MKQKTRKSILKRFRITKNGKVLRRKAGQDHGLAKNSGNRTRSLRKMVVVNKVDAKKIKKLLK